jgi:O-methyltransferase involved in polyketide biosynthesis
MKSENAEGRLSGVPETALAALYWRAMESQRPDALIEDEKAEALVARSDYDFDRVRKIPMSELFEVMRSMLTREMDRYTWDFVSRHPEATVVHIGCGLDSRFDRVDNGRVEWFDLDLPEVVDLRQELMGDEGERHHLVACSVLDDAWLESVPRRGPILFLAETVLVYLEEAQVMSLVRTLRDHFPGSELVFDGWKPFEVWLGNRYFALTGSPFAGLMQWGLWRGRSVERWGEGIHLLDEWGFFDQSEPRLARYRWMAPLFHMVKPIQIFHFQL